MSDTDAALAEGPGTPDTPSAPVARADRLVSLDFIRGIAVLGILFANITAFGHPFLAYYWPEALPNGGNVTDDIIWLVQFVFVDGKFRGLFTILFGAGLYLFMERTWERGGTRWRQARRLLLLLLFGLVHYFFLFIGDILTLYAFSGFVALAMMKWDSGRQFAVGLIWYVLASLLLTLSLAFQVAMEMSPDVAAEAGAEAVRQLDETWAEQVAEAGAETAVMTGGSYADIVAFRVTEQAGDLFEMMIIAFFETIPLILIGMALYRFGFFSGETDRRAMRRWGWIGVITGAAATFAFGWWAFAEDFPPWLTSFVFNGASALTRFPMILGLAALLVLWAPRAAQGWLGSRFVAAGRVAFSNYIGTSILMVLVFQGWAGGLFGELHRAQLLVIVVIAWALMLAWSKPWLARFRYGPLEWLWRCLTYGKLFPLRR